MALNFSYSVSLGILPVTLSVQTVGCGIKNSALPVEQAGDTEQTCTFCVIFVLSITISIIIFQKKSPFYVNLLKCTINMNHP